MATPEQGTVDYRRALADAAAFFDRVAAIADARFDPIASFPASRTAGAELAYPMPELDPTVRQRSIN